MCASYPSSLFNYPNNDGLIARNKFLHMSFLAFSCYIMSRFTSPWRWRQHGRP